MFLLFIILNSVDGLGQRSDYPPGTILRHNTTHMDVFMALFMMCAIEVVILKIMIVDQTQQQALGAPDEERTIANAMFDRELF